MRQVRAQFRVIGRTHDRLWIEDLDGPVSVTNDAEAVVENLIKFSGAGDKRIFYIDTDRQIDELVHDGTKFVDFKPGEV